MARVFLPPALRPLAGGQPVVEAVGSQVRDIIADLERQFPGIQDGLCDGNQLRAGLSVAIGDAISSLGLRQTVPVDAEVHFLPTLGGG